MRAEAKVPVALAPATRANRHESRLDPPIPNRNQLTRERDPYEVICAVGRRGKSTDGRSVPEGVDAHTHLLVDLLSDEDRCGLARVDDLTEQLHLLGEEAGGFAEPARVARPARAGGSTGGGRRR